MSDDVLVEINEDSDVLVEVNTSEIIIEQAVISSTSVNAVSRGTPVYLNYPTNTTYFIYHATEEKIQFYIANTFVGEWAL